MTKLKELSLSSNPTISSVAIHGLVAASESGRLPVTQGEDVLISLLSSTKEPLPSLVPALSKLILMDASTPDWINKYNISNRPHPLVIVLRHNWATWNAVASFILKVLKDPEL